MQQQWLDTFNLKSLDEAYIPNFSPEVKQALDSVLNGKELKINKKDLEKLIEKGREKYIQQIRQTLENPEVIFKDEKGDLIFAKNINDKLYFTNISREYKDNFLSVSLSPKKENIILNKLNNAQAIYYNELDSKLRDSSAHKAFTGVLSSTNESNNAIIPQESIKLQSNTHIGAGLLSGSGAGIEQDENGNITFNPEKFVLGLLGGVAGSKAVSSGYKRFLEKKPQQIIPYINKQKYTKPRFEVTRELEKTYRNTQVKPNEKIKDTLGLSGVIKGDFIKLAQKHPEYFANPQEAKELCDYVFNNAFMGLQASDKKQALIIAKLQDSNNDYGSVAFRIQNINGEHRIRSVILMEKKQVDLKIQNAKKLGEPIFHFW